MINNKICGKPNSSIKTHLNLNVCLVKTDPNIPSDDMINSQPKSQSNHQLDSIDIDNLSYVRMFSSNGIDLNFDFFENKQSNSYVGVSPGLSITSYDLEQTDKTMEIQPYGSVSYNHREIPEIVLAIRRRPAEILKPLVLQKLQSTQNQESCRTLSNISSPDFSPLQKKLLQVKSDIYLTLEDEDDEHYSVFDDEVNYYGIIPESKIDFLNPLEQFLILYKMRAGTFPRLREHIENEVLITMAMNLAKIERKLFKKYFPTKKVYFDDDNDYTRIKINNRKKKKHLTQMVSPEFQYVQDSI